MTEKELFPPVRDLFVKRGYKVNAEVRDCDVTATKDDEFIIIELKKADRIVTTSEMVKQVKKYHDALNKVLASTNQSNYAFEILFVLGRPVDNNDSVENREVVTNVLKPLNGRVVYYKELIENAYKAYNEYIVANKQSQPLIDMFSQLENSMKD